MQLIGADRHRLDQCSIDRRHRYRTHQTRLVRLRPETSQSGYRAKKSCHRKPKAAPVPIARTVKQWALEKTRWPKKTIIQKFTDILKISH